MFTWSAGFKLVMNKMKTPFTNSVTFHFVKIREKKLFLFGNTYTSNIS